MNKKNIGLMKIKGLKEFSCFFKKFYLTYYIRKRKKKNVENILDEVGHLNLLYLMIVEKTRTTYLVVI